MCVCLKTALHGFSMCSVCVEKRGGAFLNEVSSPFKRQTKDAAN